VDVVVQWIRTSWTKWSRGGVAAANRNAAPISFPLPAMQAPFAHVVVMREQDGFRPAESVEALTNADVSLRHVDARLRVFPRVSPPFAVPPRPRRPPAVHLIRGEWVRWQLNYRFSSAAGMQDWSYWLDTFNIAHGPTDTDLFLGAPTYFVDERGPSDRHKPKPHPPTEQ
jgi:hypothetical protein